MADYIVYADFNCPFCYALDTRLAGVTDHMSVSWRPIEHAPGARADCVSAVDHAELADEVFTVRHRAPEVDIRLPGRRPSTALPNRVYASLVGRDPRRAARFRHAVYEALWVHGRDISDPATLASLARELGIALPDSAENAPELSRWQEEWEAGPFDRRIPVVASSDGRTLLGLSAPEDILAFLTGSDLPRQGSDVCHYSARQVMLVVGGTQPIWSLLEQFTQHRDVRPATDPQHALEILLEEPPDVVILRLEAEQAIGPDLRILIVRAAQESIPVVVVDEVASTSRALEVFRRGGTEYVGSDIDAALFLARMEVQLQVRRKLVAAAQGAALDGVTRLPTALEFTRKVETEFRRARRSKLPLSLLMFDVDRFHRFTDEMGREHAELLLRRIAAVLTEVLDLPSATVGRWGADRFAALLPNLGDVAMGELARTCAEAVEARALPHPASSVAPVVTVSVGGATVFAQECESSTQLVEAVEAELERALALGGNQVSVRRIGAV